MSWKLWYFINKAITFNNFKDLTFKEASKEFKVNFELLKKWIFKKW